LDELQFLFRWFHFLAGITWIGLLYYFNFVQVPTFAEFDAGTRNNAIAKLVPRALFWFRWGAMITFLTGWGILGIKMHQPHFLTAMEHWAILLGGILGTMMWANVWFVIWPNQKVVIANAEGVLASQPANPDAPKHARRAALASRTNVVFSVPMLLFMAAGGHLPPSLSSKIGEGGVSMLLPLSWLVVIGLLEANALVGTQGPTKKPLDSVGGAIHAGFGVAIVFFVLFKVLI
jgi:uncharacterized membrane protein